MNTYKIHEPIKFVLGDWLNLNFKPHLLFYLFIRITTFQR